MPARNRIVGNVVYDPKEGRCRLLEPTSKGSLSNSFLVQLRQIITSDPIFSEEAGSMYLQRKFGTGQREIKNKYKEARKKEYKAHMTDAQKAGLKKGQEMARKGLLKPPKLTGKQRASIVADKALLAQHNRLAAGQKRSQIWSQIRAQNPNAFKFKVKKEPKVEKVKNEPIKMETGAQDHFFKPTQRLFY